MDEQIESGETTASAEELAAREVRDDVAFLGREFLTWLVYHAEDSGGA